MIKEMIRFVHYKCAIFIKNIHGTTFHIKAGIFVSYFMFLIFKKNMISSIIVHMYRKHDNLKILIRSVRSGVRSTYLDCFKPSNFAR